MGLYVVELECTDQDVSDDFHLCYLPNNHFVEVCGSSSYCRPSDGIIEISTGRTGFSLHDLGFTIRRADVALYGLATLVALMVRSSAQHELEIDVVLCHWDT